MRESYVNFCHKLDAVRKWSFNGLFVWFTSARILRELFNLTWTLWMLNGWMDGLSDEEIVLIKFLWTEAELKVGRA